MRDIFLIPNLLTVSRIILVFPAIYYLDGGIYDIALYIILFVFLSDFLDGIIARKFGMTSYIGSILDPIADKIVVISLFTYLLFVNRVNLLYYLLIITRDISQLMSIPVLLLWKKIHFHVKPKLLPKWGTALNFTLLGLVGLTVPFPKLNSYVGYVYLLYFLYTISGLIEIYILSTYIPRFIEIYQGNHNTFE